MKKLILFSLIVTLVGCSTVPQSAQINAGQSIKPIGKPTVVFIHGMFMNSDSWNEWKTYFEKENYKVVVKAWPKHDSSVADLRNPNRVEDLTKLTLEDVLAYYRDYLKTFPQKPILVGHSMGGLISQKLASEGLASAVVAIHPAAPNGMLTARWSFFKSNFDVVNPFASLDTPLTMSLEQFSYRFANGETEVEQKRAYEAYYVPESRRLGRGATEEAGVIDPLKLQTPLLLIGGGNDHIIPDSLTYRNFNFYEKSTAPVDFKVFSDRDHFTIGAPGWEAVARYSLDWLKKLE